MDRHRHVTPILLLLLLAVTACRAAIAAANPTQFEIAMAETIAMSADERMQLNAARLGRAMLQRADADANDGDDAEPSRRELKEGGRGKQLGLNPPPLNSGPSMADVNGTFFRFDSVVPNATVDWRLSKYISPIQRQFQCASCWVIAAVDSISMMWAITTKTTPAVLSPQQVCDCATKQCCKGGWPDWAFSYILFNDGIASIDEYPYVAEDSAVCNSNASTPLAAKITGWELVPPYNAMALMKAVSMQPVVAFLSGNSNDFQYYSSRDQVKIYDGTCTTDINHAVIVVGFNYTGPSLEGSYWILKNSWFNTWGDAGYMYLAMTPDVRGKCGMLTVPPMYPVYYPVGPQPARFASSQRGRWKVRRVDDLSSLLFNSALTPSGVNSSASSADQLAGMGFGAMDPCADVINPCGAGACYRSFGMARCDCSMLPDMVEVIASPTSKCVPRFPCATRTSGAVPINPCGGGTCTSTPTNKSQRNKCTCPAGFMAVTNLDKTQTCALAKVCTFFAVNPCGFGSCIDDSKGGYTCLCSAGYTLGSLTDGTTTCVPGALVTKVVLPVAMSCGLVRTTYQLSKKDFTALNPKLKCSGNFAAGTSIVVRNSTTATLGCVVPYTIAQGDTCASIATLFNVTQASVNIANPDIECNALTPGQQICVQTGSPEPQSCTSYYTVNPGETCSDVMVNTYPPISATQLYQYNPGLICTSDTSQRLVGQDLCVDSVVVGLSCSYGTYTVVRGDTCSSVVWKVFKGSYPLMYSYNPGWACSSSSLYVGKVLCKPKP